MVNRWSINGPSMVSRWSIDGESMISQRSINGQSRVSRESIDGQSMANQWSVNGQLMVSQWPINGWSIKWNQIIYWIKYKQKNISGQLMVIDCQSMVSQWSIDGQSMVNQWSVDGQSIVSLWSVDGQSMVTRWSLQVKHASKPETVGEARSNIPRGQRNLKLSWVSIWNSSDFKCGREWKPEALIWHEQNWKGNCKTLYWPQRMSMDPTLSWYQAES